VPLKISGGRLGTGRGLDRLVVVERTVALPELPDGLDGLRIAHVSDLHVGDLMPVTRVGELVARVNTLKPDLVALTGDYVDYTLEGILEPLAEVLAGFEAPLGRHLVLGNHDHLVNGPRVVKNLRAAGLLPLLEASRRIEHHGRTIALAGIDYDRRPQALAERVGRAARKARQFPPADLRLLLSHHPDAFDPGRRHGFDLTLAGHTHGGQVVMARERGTKGSVGFGSLAFQYPRGLYRLGGRYLHVTSGVGSWFPLRWRCPAEIALLTLRAASPPDDDPAHPALASTVPHDRVRRADGGR